MVVKISGARSWHASACLVALALTAGSTGLAATVPAFATPGAPAPRALTAASAAEPPEPGAESAGDRVSPAPTDAGGEQSPARGGGAGSDVRELPERVFADDSFWYRPLPDATPTDPRSAAMVDHLVDQAEQHFGQPGRPNVTVNLRAYSPPIYVAQPGDPEVTFIWDNCQDKTDGDSGLIADQLTDVRVPAVAVPAEGSDAEMVVYDPAADRVIETWMTARDGDTWSACWGGAIENASADDGIFDAPFGVAASGLALLGGTIRATELQRGQIEHVIGIALPFAAEKPERSLPATRTDGRNPTGRPAPAQGQMMRLPADLDLAALRLSPAARAIAEAAQSYGIVVWDTAGAVSFRGENPIGLESDPYREIFRGRNPHAELAGDRSRGEVDFPLELLEVLPVDYTTELTSTPPGSPTPPGAPWPAASEPPAEAGDLPVGTVVTVGAAVSVGALAVTGIAAAAWAARRRARAASDAAATDE